MAQQGQVAPLYSTPLNDDERRRASLADFATDRESDVPVGTQLVWSLRSLMARRVLLEGDKLPSVRELAEFAGVNVNTARAAYATLEAEGAIGSERGRGTYVLAAKTTGDLCALIERTLAAAHEAGIHPRDLAASIWPADPASGTELPAPPITPIEAGADEAVLRRELRSQIARLESELATYAWLDPVQPPPAQVETAKPVPRVASTEELHATRDVLIERLMRLREVAERRGSREQLARERVEAMRESPGDHRWEIVAAADAGGREGDWACGAEVRSVRGDPRLVAREVLCEVNGCDPSRS